MIINCRKYFGQIGSVPIVTEFEQIFYIDLDKNFLHFLGFYLLFKRPKY